MSPKTTPSAPTTIPARSVCCPSTVHIVAECRLVRATSRQRWVGARCPPLRSGPARRAVRARRAGHIPCRRAVRRPGRDLCAVVLAVADGGIGGRRRACCRPLALAPKPHARRATARGSHYHPLRLVRRRHPETGPAGRRGDLYDVRGTAPAAVHLPPRLIRFARTRPPRRARHRA